MTTRNFVRRLPFLLLPLLAHKYRVQSLERAKLKARLVTLLRESLYDDVKGIANIARGKEMIKKLAS